MIFPQARVGEVCAWTADEAAQARARAQAGDLSALADWLIHAVFRRFRREGLTAPAAIRQTRILADTTDLKLSVTHG